MSQPRNPRTVAAANGIAADGGFGAVTPPIYLSSTFAFQATNGPGRTNIRVPGTPIRRQQANAMAVAAFLRDQSQVSAVHYPGLAAHPGHAMAKAQQAGFGAMLSFELVGGVDAVRCFVEALEVVTLAGSLAASKASSPTPRP
jgi:cystathionine beta-lyase/cystathionine gamma-synthase